MHGYVGEDDGEVVYRAMFMPGVRLIFEDVKRLSVYGCMSIRRWNLTMLMLLMVRLQYME